MPLMAASMALGMRLRLFSLSVRTTPSKAARSATVSALAPASSRPIFSWIGSVGSERRGRRQSDRVRTFLRRAGLPADLDAEIVRGGQERPRCQERLAQRLRPDAQAENGHDRRIVQDALFNQERGAAVFARIVLVARLEDEFDAAVQAVPEGGQDHGRAQSDRGVQVVSGSVHHSGIEGFKGDVSQLLDRIGVHVGAQGDHGSGLGAVQHGDQPGPAYARPHFESERLQPAADELGRLPFPSRELRVHMDEAPDLDQLGPRFLDFAIDVGSGFLVHRSGGGTNRTN